MAVKEHLFEQKIREFRMFFIHVDTRQVNVVTLPQSLNAASSTRIKQRQQKAPHWVPAGMLSLPGWLSVAVVGRQKMCLTEKAVKPDRVNRISGHRQVASIQPTWRF